MRGELRVRAAEADDAVLALRVHKDEGGAGAGVLRHADAGDVETFAREEVEIRLAVGVIPHAADEADDGSLTRGGEGLVRALPSVAGLPVVGDDGVPRLRKMRDREERVHIERSDDGDGGSGDGGGHGVRGWVQLRASRASIPFLAHD